MVTNIHVTKNGKENNAGLLRRFSRRVQEAGIVRTVKGKRYMERPASPKTKKASALNRIAKGKHYNKLRKLGKIS